MRSIALTLTALLIPVLSAQTAEEFPLRSGLTWVYAGTVKRGPSSKVVRLESRVAEYVRRGYVEAALVRDCPLSLISDAAHGRDCVIVKAGSDRIYILEPPRTAEAMRRLRDLNDELVGLVSESELVLDLPLAAGKRIGESAQLTRQCAGYSTSKPSCGYAWVVSPAPAGGYELVWNGLSGRKIVRFQPRVGITSFLIQHGPTGESAEIHLVEGSPAGNKAPR